LFVFLGLAARFAAFRRRITALPEKLLILRRKREGLPAIAAHELLIFSHISLSSLLQLCDAFEIPPNLAVLPRSLAFAVDRYAAKSVELIDCFPAIAMSNEFRLEFPDGESTLFAMRASDSRNFHVMGVARRRCAQRAARTLSPGVGILT
jgi:hypothetical protein